MDRLITVKLPFQRCTVCAITFVNRFSTIKIPHKQFGLDFSNGGFMSFI
jgi:hypothetical protein